MRHYWNQVPFETAWLLCSCKFVVGALHQTQLVSQHGLTNSQAISPKDFLSPSLCRAFSVGSLGGVHGPVVGQDPSPFSRLQHPTASCGNLPASRGWRRSISSLAAGLEEFSVSSSGCSSSAKGDAGLGHVVVPAALTSVGQAVKAIRSGRVVAVPTDTLYGELALPVYIREDVENDVQF